MMVTSLVDQAVKLRVTARLASQANKEQDGFAPTEIDAAMDKLIGTLVESIVPGSTYVSEENNKNYYPHEGEIFS
jgi:hypothetical protein